ncbi:MAG: SDR family NAD(P)-dependent oxidoreductase [Leptospiraceae bacterium]|nr:SDR family NAD(P)-dependent oxidoreductase [Leptospiraceae bacterium]MCP5503160.1 SDR family NAD(P)-dependent oxidoreductase [Leptospiraceae bacterium]
MGKKIIVVGASSGMGAEIAREKLKNGDSVCIVARRQDKLKALAEEFNKNGEIKAISIINDVTNFSSVETAFNKAVDTMGGLDEIYYCSGLMESIRIEEYSTEKDIRTLNVNLGGAFAWLNPAADYFQRKGEGKIIGVSSVAGDRGRVKNPSYHAAKAGFTTYLESLRNRLNKKGKITVLTVRPGFVDTEMTKGMEGLFWLISANEAAKTIIKAAEKNCEDIYVPARWRLVMFIIRNIPSFIFKKLSV